MRRATALAVVIGVTAGLLGGTGIVWSPAVAAQAAEDPSPALSVQELMRKGSDEFRWGNYDEAYRAFEEAAKRPNLTEHDQALLNRYRPRVNQARQSIQEAGQALQSAQQALEAGDYKQAETLAQAAAENTYVSSDVREEAKALLAKSQAVNSGAVGAKPDRDEPRRRQAQQLLANARKQLRDGNVTEAEKLARQAEALRLSFNRFEDSPAKVLRDVSDARKGKSVSGGVSNADDSKKARALVAEAESKLRHNEWEQAEALAQQAKALNVKFLWYEKTPEDLLAEVQKVRRRQAPPAAGAGQSRSGVAAQAADPQDTKMPPELAEPETIAPPGEAAGTDQIAVTDQGTKGQTSESRGQRSEMSGQKEDPQDKSTDHSPPTTHHSPMTTHHSPVPTHQVDSRAAREEALELLRQGRAQLREGNLDEAYRLAQLARDKKANYGLLDDTPARLAEDVARARARLKSAPPAGSEEAVSAQAAPELAAIPANRPPGKDKDVRRQAANLLKKAREYMARGDYDTAIEIAQRVNGWNLDYSLWDDTPGRVDSAARAMRSGVVARSARGQAQQQAQQEKGIAENLLAEARRDLKQGRLDEAELKAHQAQELRVNYAVLADRPETVLEDIAKVRRRQLESAMAAEKTAALKAARAAAASASQTKQTAPSPSTEAPQEVTETAARPTTTADASSSSNEATLSDAQKKAQARQLAGQARKMIEAGQLDEAEQLIAQAESYQVNWGVFGESPEKLRRDLVRVRARSSAGQGTDDKAIAESLVTEARRDLKQGRLDEAEHKARQAQQLGVTFSMFADRPESVLDEVKRVRRRSGQTSGRIAAEANAGTQAPNTAATESEMTPVVPPSVVPPSENAGMTETKVAEAGPESGAVSTLPTTVDNSLPPHVVKELAPVGTRELTPRVKSQPRNDQVSPNAEQVAKSTTPKPIVREPVDVQPNRADPNDSALQSVEPATPAKQPAAKTNQNAWPVKVDEELAQVASKALTPRPKTDRPEQRSTPGPQDVQPSSDNTSTSTSEGIPSIPAAQANAVGSAAPTQNVPPTRPEDLTSLSPAQKQVRGRQLVAQARKLIEAGQLDDAEQSIVQAESLRLRWGYMEDSPVTVRRALTVARSRQVAKTAPTVAPPGTQGNPAAIPDRVRQELSGARSGQLPARDSRAQPKEQPAQAQPATTPEVAQVNAESGGSTGESEVVAAAPPQAPLPTAEAGPVLTPDQKKTRARQLLAQARKLIDTGYLVEAEQCIVQAEAMQVKWRGLFGESPESLRRDLARARTQKDKAVALSLLAEARAALQQGRLDEAEHKARQAQQIQVIYGRWSDRPDLVLADVIHTREGQAERITATPDEPTAIAAGPIQPASMTGPALSPATTTSGAVPGGDMVRIVEPTIGAPAAEPAAVPTGTTPPTAAQQYLDGAKSERISTQTPRPRPGVRLEAGVQTTEASPQQVVEQTNLSARSAPIIREPRGPDVTEQKAMELMSRGDFEAAQQLLRNAGRMTTPPAPADPYEPKLEWARKLFEAGNYPRAKEQALEVQAASPMLRPQAEELVARISVMEQSMVLQFYEAGEAAARKGEYTRAIAFFKQVEASGVPLDPLTEHQLRSYLRDLPGRAAQARSSAAPGSAAVANGEVQPSPSPQQGPTGGGLESAAQRQRVQFQQLVTETNQKVQSAKRLLTSDPAQAIKELEQAREHVRASGLDESMTGPLMRRVDTAIQFAGQAKQRFEVETLQQQADEARKAELQRELAVQHQKQQEMQKRIENAQALMKEGRFAEAEEVAKVAAEIDPDHPAVVALRFKAKVENQLEIQKEIKEKKAAGFLSAMSSVDEAAIPKDDRFPISYPDARRWEDLSESRRKQLGRLESGRKTEKELEIERKLTESIDVSFTETPLAEVVAYLRDMTGVNMWLDEHALQTDGISSDRPISMKLDHIMLKNVLKLMLSQMDLTYTVQNEALVITTPVKSQGSLYFITYQVGDLVVPVPNYTGNHFNMIGSRYAPPAFGGGPDMRGNNRIGIGGAGAFPSVGIGQVGNGLAGNAQLGGGQNALGQFGSGLAGSQPLGTGSSTASLPRSPAGGLGAGMSGQQVDFDSLVNLIQQTISPNTWSSVGGSGTVEPFQANLSLVVNQTQAVHEAIADLLAQLRRLQDLQVAVEVKFISLTENFFERIGIDFDMQLQSNQQRPLRHFGGTVTPAAGNLPATLQTNYLDHEDDFAVGVNAPNAIFQDVRGFTPDFKIPFRTGNFGKGRPTTNFLPGDGINFGIAFLSDLEVSLFLEAAQANNRGNVLSAPKVTLFNGAFAFVFSGTIEPFITELDPVISAGAVSFQPQIDQVLNGAGLGVQAVISADRRYVRLNLQPLFQQIARVETFRIPAAAGGGGNVLGGGGGGVAIEGELRIPVIAANIVATTVTVPDGGTVLMGGVKSKTERRNEAGVPILSKIPYINRLFTDTGVESQTSSLLLMVTPRIIILEEEEELLGKGGTVAF